MDFLPGPLSAHMLQHIVLMNVAAPVLVAITKRLRPGLHSSNWVRASMVQLVVLWVWHTPVLMGIALTSHAGHLAMQITLFAAAIWFWSAIFSLAGTHMWQSMLALLISAKLFCLLGALLIFAGRPLYAIASHHGSVTVADQEMAGLMMIVACPLSYVVAGIVLAAFWFGEIEKIEPA